MSEEPLRASVEATHLVELLVGSIHHSPLTPPGFP